MASTTTKMAQPPTPNSAPGVDHPQQFAMAHAYGIATAAIAILILAVAAVAYLRHRRKRTTARTRALPDD